MRIRIVFSKGGNANVIGVSKEEHLIVTVSQQDANGFLITVGYSTP